MPRQHQRPFHDPFFLTVELARKHFEWVRAGHEPALLYDPGRDRFEELQGDGLALGIDETAVYPIVTRNGLRPGQVIAVGTDGIWEAYDRNGAMFGKTRFQDPLSGRTEEEPMHDWRSRSHVRLDCKYHFKDIQARYGFIQRLICHMLFEKLSASIRLFNPTDQPHRFQCRIPDLSSDKVPQ
ncbi:MAG: serine/threonine-protein phosphatase [Desulfosarcina sp.]|nr:serine/threonine-protein phosphatase [Desulfobacterales bacterium]